MNFESNKGDKISIIGRNGAGKSTLLKVLSRITGPTTGKIHINARIASLLEVVTDFHHEFTGRDKINRGAPFFLTAYIDSTFFKSATKLILC